MARLFLLAGALYGATGVFFCAFGAHGLSSRLSQSAMSTWETAVHYQLVHALALLCVAIMCGVRVPRTGVPHTREPHVEVSLSLRVAGWGLMIGVLLFSGSLYLLALFVGGGEGDGEGVNSGLISMLGPLTPAGGVAFIVGWAGLVVEAIRRP